ncbi:MAG: hypothetical protein HC930_03635 [Hydrococcus sp. SU_1_0]|nr:hypothetical protein [Hydrococcus sp. SU_1_0]
MLDNYKSVPFLAVISILLLTPVGIGALVYSSVRSDYTDQSSEKAGESTTASSSLGESSRKSSAQFTPSASSGGGHELNPTPGIPTGTYSNPPTTIKSGSGIAPTDITSPQPTNDFPSSVDRNRAIQQSLNNSGSSSLDHPIPDYSSPSPSNNYQSTQDNSLIKPLSENSSLETPESTPEPVLPLAPVVQPQGYFVLTLVTKK